MAAKEMGHVSSRFTFDVYEQASDLRDWLSGPERAEFDRGVEWASWAQESAGAFPGESAYWLERETAV